VCFGVGEERFHGVHCAWVLGGLFFIVNVV